MNVFNRLFKDDSGETFTAKIGLTFLGIGLVLLFLKQGLGW